MDASDSAHVFEVFRRFYASLVRLSGRTERRRLGSLYLQELLYGAKERRDAEHLSSTGGRIASRAPWRSPAIAAPAPEWSWPTS